VNYPILLANEGTTRDYGGIVGIPTTFVIDRSGKIVKRFIGFTPPEVFEGAIRPLLETTG
jgi:glutathione peroxidase-family protein